MKKKVLIITGGSKGIGSALVGIYRDRGFEIHTISRTFSKELDDPSIFQYPYDLENIPQLQNLFSQIIERYESGNVEKITLINNAATLGKIGTLESCAPETLQAAVDINLTAPLILSARFILHTQDWPCSKSIINMSSGAARKPYHGWVAYSTTKAAMEMLTMGIANEQEDRDYPIKSIAIIPGVVETGMQEELRKVSKDDFKDVERFIDLKKKGLLSDPAVIAGKIFAVDQEGKEKNGSIVSVREN